MNQITLTIDGKKVSVSEGTNIVDAAKEVDIDIPTLCYRKELKPFTSCFVCVVEIKGAPKLEPACSTSVQEGMEVLTDSPKVRDTRKTCLELLVSEHFGDCLSPCRLECPASCDIQAYLKAIFEDNFKKAASIIQETISIPSSIGRVCPRPCESKCRREHKEESVAICSLKRSAGDEVLNSPLPIQAAESSGKKVAIIGAGPAGINAAYFLKQLGHDATLFEAQPKPGGMMQYGIPEYRLPKALLQKEIANLQLNIEYNTEFGKDITLDGLKKQGYDAFLIAIGAWKAASMRVEGEDQEGIIAGIDFLKKVESNEIKNIGKKVIIVGGGNTAIDAARTSLRLSADVTMLYRRTRNEMPADDFEIDAALEEGVNIEFLTAPTKITKENELLKIECIRMQLGEPDASGRRRPVAIEDSEFSVFADTIISAIGQKIEAHYLEEIGLSLYDWGAVKVDEITCQTNVDNIFSAGDCVLGPYIACAAIGLGRIAAISIDQYLRGEKVVGEGKPFSVEMGSIEDVPEAFYLDIEYAKRHKMPELPVKERIDNFKEVELGFSKTVAIEEASRCLECGCRKAENCMLRNLSVEYKADPDRFKGDKKTYYLDKSHPDIIFESNKCVLCGCCVRYCNDVAKQDVMGFVNRGFDTVVRPALEKPLGTIEFDFADKLVEVCPTGAISSK